MSELLPGEVFTAISPGESMQRAEEAFAEGGPGSPRFILGMPDEQYHSRQELSASGMKVLLHSPKHFQQARSVRVNKPEFDVGHAAHARILGVGLPAVKIPQNLLSEADNGIRSAAAKAWVAKARADGQVPLKPAVFAQVMRMSDAVLMNPKARRLLEVDGVSEVSMFGTDPELGVRLRGRIDRLYADPVTGRITIIDVKTTNDLRWHKLQRVIEDFSYDLSMEVYRFLVELIAGVIPDPAVLIFCEKDPPYDVRVVRLAELWSQGGWRKFRAAVAAFARCEEERTWPGVDEDEGPIQEIEPPSWYAARERAEEGASDEW